MLKFSFVIIFFLTSNFVNLDYFFLLASLEEKVYQSCIPFWRTNSCIFKIFFYIFISLISALICSIFVTLLFMFILVLLLSSNTTFLIVLRLFAVLAWFILSCVLVDIISLSSVWDCLSIFHRRMAMKKQKRFRMPGGTKKLPFSS